MDYSETIDGKNITDWPSFHKEFQAKMGFFEGYGKNSNAWIDCMTDMYTNDEYKSLTKFNLNEGDRFILRVINSETWKKQSPETFDAFIDYSIGSNDEKIISCLSLNKASIKENALGQVKVPLILHSQKRASLTCR